MSHALLWVVDGAEKGRPYGSRILKKKLDRLGGFLSKEINWQLRSIFHDTEQESTAGLRRIWCENFKKQEIRDWLCKAKI